MGEISSPRPACFNIYCTQDVRNEINFISNYFVSHHHKSQVSIKVAGKNFPRKMLISSKFVVLAHLKLLSGLILDAFSIVSQDRQMWTQSVIDHIVLQPCHHFGYLLTLDSC